MRAAEPVRAVRRGDPWETGTAGHSRLWDLRHAARIPDSGWEGGRGWRTSQGGVLGSGNGRGRAFGEGAGGGGKPAESVVERVAVEHAALETGDLGFGIFPKCGNLLAQLAGQPLVTLIQVVVQRALPIVQPGADLAFELVDRGLGGFGGFQGGDLLNLQHQPLDFLALLERAAFEFRAGGFGEPLQRLLKRFQPGFVGAQAVFPLDGHVAGGRSGFKVGDPLLETFEMAANDDFPDAFDRLGWIEG